MIVKRWAALVVEPAASCPQTWGAVVPEKVLPASSRRRMGALERAMARCALGVLAGVEAAEVICASRYGNFNALVPLLRSLADQEPLSPMTFSMSVHNALAGLLGQIRRDRSAHTAVAAGRNTLASGLVEAYCQLVAEPERPVALVFGDMRLPDVYAEFGDEEPLTLVLALLLSGNKSVLPATVLAPITLDTAQQSIDGSFQLARKLIFHLSDSTSFTFCSPNGLGWSLGAA